MNIRTSSQIRKKINKKLDYQFDWSILLSIDFDDADRSAIEIFRFTKFLINSTIRLMQQFSAFKRRKKKRINLLADRAVICTSYSSHGAALLRRMPHNDSEHFSFNVLIAVDGNFVRLETPPDFCVGPSPFCHEKKKDKRRQRILLSVPFLMRRASPMMCAQLT